MTRRALVTEAQVQAACLELLRLRGFPAWRTNAGAIRDATGRPVRMLPAGFPDVLALVPRSGRALFVECKRPGGRATANQLAFLSAARRTRAAVAVVSDVGHLCHVLDLLDADPWTEDIP